MRARRGEPEVVRGRWGAALVVLGNSIALYNPPLRVAEEFAMLDVLSGGRVTLGVGVGWLKEEFDALGAAGTVSLTTGDGATHMRVTIRCASAEHLAQFLQHGVDVGTAQTLDNLVAHVTAARAA